MRTFSEFKKVVAQDLFRYKKSKSLKDFLTKVTLSPGFKYMFWFRLTTYLKHKRWLRFLYYIAKLNLRRLRYKYGIEIPENTKIGPGFYIGHFGGIIVNPKATIGKNCNISQGVTIGQSNRGDKKGYPTIGDYVFMGPGCVILGGIKIGNYAAIGANAVVTKDVPEYAVVVGVPAKIISMDGSTGYINNILDDELKEVI